MHIGFELPNRPEVTREEWERYDALKADVVKLRSYHWASPTTRNEILRRQPNVIILRPDRDEDFRERRNGTLHAQVLAATAASIQGASNARIAIIVDNEPNLGGVAVPGNYFPLAVECANELHRILGDNVIVVAPPLAVAQNDGAWNDALKPVANKFDAIGCHLYGQANTDLAHRSLGLALEHGKPVICDEVGDSGHSTEADKAYIHIRSYITVAYQRGVDIFALFIMGGTDDWANFWLSPTVLAGLRQRLDAMEERVTPVIKTMPPFDPPAIDVRSRLPHGYKPRPVDAINHVAIHHTAAAPTEPLDAAGKLRRIDVIQRSHKDRLNGFAYHFYVFADGDAFYTGDILTTRWVNGGDSNLHTIAICLDGNFTSVHPTDAQLAKAAELIEYLRTYLEWPDMPVYGHKEVSSESTACPGRTFEEWGPMLKRYIVLNTKRLNDIITALNSQWGWAGVFGKEGNTQAEKEMRDSVVSIKNALGLQ